MIICMFLAIKILCIFLKIIGPKLMSRHNNVHVLAITKINLVINFMIQSRRNLLEAMMLCLLKTRQLKILLELRRTSVALIKIQQ